jgi:ArsR family metal-binding transcriptional regulator
MEPFIERRQGYSYYLVNIDCLRTSTGFNVIMDLESSVGDLLPFLAACLPGCNYVHGSEVIDLMDAGHIVGIYPSQITITGVEGKEEAERLCRKYFERIRDAAGRKDTITPVYVSRPALGVLDILRLLPRTNCGDCSSPSCMAFAARVFRREADLAACPHFLDELAEHPDLVRRLKADGYAVPCRDRASPGRDPCRG